MTGAPVCSSGPLSAPGLVLSPSSNTVLSGSRMRHVSTASVPWYGGTPSVQRSTGLVYWTLVFLMGEAELRVESVLVGLPGCGGRSCCWVRMQTHSTALVNTDELSSFFHSLECAFNSVLVG